MFLIVQIFFQEKRRFFFKNISLLIPFCAKHIFAMGIFLPKNLFEYENMCYFVDINLSHTVSIIYEYHL